MSRVDAYPDLKSQMDYCIREAQRIPGCKDCDIGAIRAKYEKMATEEDDRLNRKNPKDRRRFRA